MLHCACLPVPHTICMQRADCGCVFCCAHRAGPRHTSPGTAIPMVLTKPPRLGWAFPHLPNMHYHMFLPTHAPPHLPALPPLTLHTPLHRTFPPCTYFYTPHTRFILCPLFTHLPSFLLGLKLCPGVRCSPQHEHSTLNKYAQRQADFRHRRHGTIAAIHACPIPLPSWHPHSSRPDPTPPSLPHKVTHPSHLPTPNATPVLPNPPTPTPTTPPNLYTCPASHQESPTRHSLHAIPHTGHLAV